MATTQTIINRSLRLLNQLSSGESPTVDESNDALMSINAMLDSWRNDRLMCYAIQTQNIPIANGNQTRTIGPTGNLVTSRPVEVLSAYVLNNNFSYDVRILNEIEYAALPDKQTTSNWPDHIYYQPSMPNGTLFLYPIPTATSTLVVLTRTVITDLALIDTIAMPPGWEDALAFNLSIRLAPEYQAAVSGEVREMAVRTLAAIKKQNSRPLKLYTELPYLAGRNRSNIISDRP